MGEKQKKKVTNEEGMTEHTNENDTSGKENTEAFEINEEELKKYQVEAANLKTNEAEIKEYQDEITNLKDQCLRAHAETENVRRRGEKETQEARKFGITGVVKDLVNVIESLYRATEHINEEDKKNDKVNKIVEGIELTRKELMSVLSKNNVKRVEPKPGDVFDHNFHQALSQVPNNNYPKNAIIKIIQAGYLIEDRLIKPALVIVSAGEAK